MAQFSTMLAAARLFGLGATAALMVPSSVEAFVYRFGETSLSSNSTATGAAAVLEFDFQDLDSNRIQLDLTVTNTTGVESFGSGATTSKLTGVAFDLPEGISLISRQLGQQLDTLLKEVSVAPFGSGFDLALADNNNFLGGNANQALAQGERDRVALVLTGEDTAVGLRSRFAQAFASGELRAVTRFQQVNAGAGSDKLLGGTVITDEPARVNEPGLVAGLAAISIALRRRRRA